MPSIPCYAYLEQPRSSVCYVGMIQLTLQDKVPYSLFIDMVVVRMVLPLVTPK